MRASNTSICWASMIFRKKSCKIRWESSPYNPLPEQGKILGVAESPDVLSAARLAKNSVELYVSLCKFNQVRTRIQIGCLNG